MSKVDDKLKYMRLLAEKYPSQRAVKSEIINLTAILNLPKGTEHFMSDLHGEYEAFCHILKNCSGVIREKMERLYADTLSHDRIKEICTLIYYPSEKLRLLKKEGVVSDAWYRATLECMLEIARVLSSKYTRSKVRKAMPSDYAYIIDELLHAQKDEDNNQVRYHHNILDTIIRIDADNFVIALADLIKRVAVDRLHIVGDIYDRGESAEKIMDLLMSHHSLDIEWGNHDILWMGAACGSDICVATVVRNCLHYHTLETLETGYGISLRSLALFAEQLYPGRDPMAAAEAAITVLMFKLEGQAVLRNPDFGMEHRKLLDKIDYDNHTIGIDGTVYRLNETLFPTVDPGDPYKLTADEKALIHELRSAFLHSRELQKHTAFMYERGSMYRIHNQNLLFHGCVPMDEDGELSEIRIFGGVYSGRDYFDMAERTARSAFYSRTKDQKELDFMWFLYCAALSPLSGRMTRTFERTYINDQSAWHEEKNPYYRHYYRKEICEKILAAFGLQSSASHIINGHTPVRTVKGELPIRAEGKLLVIDGGFCKNYHETTGIAGYTLIYNSHGLRLKAHHPFHSVEEALLVNRDIHFDSEIVETASDRIMIEDIDVGETLRSDIDDLYTLLEYYRKGLL